MLLPLLLLLLGESQSEEPFEDPGIPKTDKSNTLGNLFDIKLGLIQDRYLNISKDTGSPVHFINLKAFTDVQEKEKKIIKGAQLTQLNKLGPKFLEEIQKSSQKGSKDSMQIRKNKKRLPVKTENLLTKEVFLITVRGMPIGYSLLNINELDTFDFAATHHFIRLKALKSFTTNHSYAHLILNQLVKHDLCDSFENKINSDKSRSEYASFNSVKVEDLKNVTINYHSDPAVQQQVYELFESKYKQWHYNNLAFENFQSKLNESFNPTQYGG